MNNRALAERIRKALTLDLPPIALTFTDTPPAGVASPDRVVPSACAFWRLAERSVFYAPAETHDNCAIGAMVMGFPLSEQVQQQLGEVMTSMCGCAYLSPEEGDKIPTIQIQAAGILYGPLAELPAQPDLVLLWLTPRRAMLYNEAAGTASWTQSPILATGRPGCAALPSALSSGDATLSWGCTGMRFFTEIPDDQILAAIPGNRVETFADDLDRILESNATMRTYYETKKAELLAK